MISPIYGPVPKKRLCSKYDGEGYSKKTEKKIDGTCFGSRVSMIVLENGLVSAMSTHGFSSCCDLLYEQTQGLKNVGETIGTDIVSYFQALCFCSMSNHKA